MEAGAPLTRARRAIAVDETSVAYRCDVAPSCVLSPVDVNDRFGGPVLELLREEVGLRIAQTGANITAVSADTAFLVRSRFHPEKRCCWKRRGTM